MRFALLSRFVRPLIAATALAGLAACGTRPPAAPLPTVAHVDLDRYLGRWYEVAALPAWFQAKCVGDTQAEYRREGERIEVRNSCRTATGSRDEASAVAEVVPDTGNAKLRVSFWRPFYGDYWVLALDPDYRWVLVGEPGRRFGWVLSRTPLLPAADLEAALGRAEQLGYARADFRLTPQTPTRITPVLR